MRKKGTHCKSGRHELKGNVYIYANGKRACKICKLEYHEEYNRGRKILKRIKDFVKSKKIVMAGVWKYSELKRLKQSIGSCYLAEIRAAQTGTFREGTHINQADFRRLSA